MAAKERRVRVCTHKEQDRGAEAGEQEGVNMLSGAWTESRVVSHHC